MRYLFIYTIILMGCQTPKTIKSAKWVEQSYGVKAHVRGIHAVSEKVCWLAGSKGTFSHTNDGGTTWITDSVPGATKLEFRDVHAFDENNVLLLSIGPGDNSRIYKTTDAGKNWTIVFKNSNEKAFFDAFEFWDDKRGFTMSDIVDGKILVFTTEDGGNSWNQVPEENIPPALEGEGSFAASGTNVMAFGNGQGWIGGSASPSRVYNTLDYGKTWTVVNTPIQSEAPSAGIFSIAFYDQNLGMAVGGNYSDSKNTDRCIILTKDGGKTWTLTDNPNTIAFKSCVRFVPGTMNAITVGRSGSEYSNDFGQTWTSFGDVVYYTMSFAPNSKVAWAAGPNGNLAKLELVD